LRNIKVIILLILFVSNYFIIKAQGLYPLNKEIQLRIDRALALSESSIHTSFKPIIVDETSKYFNKDSILLPEARSIAKDRSWAIRKLLSEHFISVDSNSFKIYIDPIMEFSLGQENSKYPLYINSRGFDINVQISQKLWVNSSFIETQAKYPTYITKYVNKYGVAPGQTIVKDFKENAYDYGVAYGIISYSPFKFLNIQGGQGKNFIGDGYRSLFLSDNSFQYPFIKFTINYQHLQYVSMATLLQNIDTKGIIWAPHPWESPFIKKPASFNYLTYNLFPNLQLGLFEGIMFRSPWGKALTWKFFNPVILTRTIRYTLNGENNIILGLNAKYHPLRKIILYGQLAIDDIKLSRIGKGDSKNRTGFQTGIQIFDPFNIKNLIILQEFNQVRPYTYSHEFTRQTYTAYNQALAHPLGANFNEYISIIDYRYKRWHIYNEILIANYGSDNTGQNWGQNIFLSNIYINQIDPTTSNYTGQGKYTEINYFLIKGGYLINPKTNLNVSVGYYSRMKKYLHSPGELSSCYFISVATSLFNQYLDF